MSSSLFSVILFEKLIDSFFTLVLVVLRVISLYLTFLHIYYQDENN
jgi:hypothetical protein